MHSFNANSEPLHMYIFIYKNIYIKQKHKVLQRVYHEIQVQQVRVRLRVLNATFNNISVISWRSVLLVERDTGVPGKNTDLSQLAYNHDSLSNQK
jgi:hypothetical protein